ncbi:hypothetical protein PFISCL1PPCAC_26374, partial [Pristionchus fissidentatus]
CWRKYVDLFKNYNETTYNQILDTFPIYYDYFDTVDKASGSKVNEITGLPTRHIGLRTRTPHNSPERRDEVAAEWKNLRKKQLKPLQWPRRCDPLVKR